MLINGKTTTGFEFAIDDRIKKDWRLVKLYADLTGANDQSAQISACMELVKMLFTDGGAALEDHVKSLNEGFVPADVFMTEISEILNYDDDLKK